MKKKCIVKIHFSTIIYLMLCFSLRWMKESLLLMSLLLIHECFHYNVAKWLNYEIEGMTLYPFGAILKLDDDKEHRPIEDFLVACAGAMSHLFFFIFKDVFLYFFKAHLYHYYLMFNTQILIFNILPIYPLDGYKMILALLKMRFDEKTCLTMMKYVSLFSLGLFILKYPHLIQLFLVKEQFYLWQYQKFEKSVKKRLF